MYTRTVEYSKTNVPETPKDIVDEILLENPLFFL